MPSVHRLSGKRPRVTKVRTPHQKRSHQCINDQQFSTITSRVGSSQIAQNHDNHSEDPPNLWLCGRKANSLIEKSSTEPYSTINSHESCRISTVRSDTTFTAHKHNKSLPGTTNLKEISPIGRTSPIVSIKTMSKNNEHHINRKRRRTVFGYPCPCSPCCCYLLTLSGVFLAIAVAVIAVSLSLQNKTTINPMLGTKNPITMTTSTTQITTTITTTVTATTSTITTSTSTVTTMTVTTTTSTVTTRTTTTTATTTTSATTTTTSTTMAPVFNVNMLVNGDAETGSCATDGDVTTPTGWTTNGNITQLAYNNTIIYDRVNGVPVPTDRGDCFFYGNNESNTTMWQTVNLAAYADSSLIDNYTVRFNLSAWLGGFRTHNDRPSVWLTFYDQNSQVVGPSSNVGPVTNTHRGNNSSFLFRQTTGLVPVGARSMTLLVMIERDVGGINDGYVDNISVFLYS